MKTKNVVFALCLGMVLFICGCKSNNSNEMELAPYYDIEKKTYGYIDKKGDVIIEAQYEYVLDFSDGLGCVRDVENITNEDGKLPKSYKRYLWSVINKSGKYIVKKKYNYMNSYSNGVALVGMDTTDWYMTQSGEYDIKKKWGYIDKNGNEIIPLQYDWATDFSEGLAIVKKDGKFMGIDINGDIAFICPEIEGYPNCYFESYFDGRAVIAIANEEFIGQGVSIWDKYGYIDKEGNIAIPLDYDAATQFCDGIARVYKNGKSIYINTKGEPIYEVNSSDEQLYDFKYGLGIIKNKLEEGKYIVIDKNGNKILKLQEIDHIDVLKKVIFVEYNLDDSQVRVELLDHRGEKQYEFTALKNQVNCSFNDEYIEKAGKDTNKYLTSNGDIEFEISNKFSLVGNFN